MEVVVTERSVGPGMLCERCGYAIEGLPESGACSECGEAVARSLPARRAGSAFQRSPSMFSLVMTAWRTLRHPRATFDEVRIGPGEGRLLLVVYLLVAAVPFSVGPWLDLARVFVHSRGVGWALNLVVTLVVLSVLTQTEAFGIRLFGRKNRWRVTRDVARVVCAHAAVGWAVGGVLFAVVLAAPVPTLWVRLPALLGGFEVNVSAIVPPVISVGIGLLVFELLVYLGVRRCRFANPGDQSGKPAERGASSA